MAPVVRRLLLGVCLCLTLPALARAQQQIADPNFDTKVETPAFVTRHPKVLFDHGHHNTHTTHARYDALSEVAEHDGFEVMIDTNRFDARDLAGGDILLIANPLGCDTLRSPNASRSAFTPQECDAVHRWVANGGSLLLIAEHAPMGMAAKLLAARFGVDFNAGYLVDLTLADTTLGSSTLIYSTATHTLGDHPITRGHVPAERIRRIRTYTGQSMSVPAGGVALLRVTDGAQDLTLGPNGVNGPIPDSLRHNAAGRAQGIAFTVGKGRVVMFGEATMFSAQLVPGPNGEKRKIGMNAPGFDNRQLLLNTLHWLAHALN